MKTKATGSNERGKKEQKAPSRSIRSKPASYQRQVEALLRESEERYRLIVEYSPNAIAVHQDGKLVFVNPAALKLMRAQSAEQLLGKPIAEIVHTTDLATVQQRIARMLAGESVESVEEHFVRLDGTIVPVEVIAAPFTYNGKPAIQVIVTDITERKRIEDALLSAESRYRSVVENAVEGIFQSTPTGTFLHVNSAMAQIYGYDSPEDMIYSVHNITHQIYVHRADRDRFIRLLNENGRIEDFEAPNYRKDRSIVWTRTNARIFQRDDGSVIYEGFLTDITERKRAEEEVQRSEQIYRQAIEVAGAVPYYESYYDEGRKIKYEFIGEGIHQITGYGPEEFSAQLWDTLVEEVVMVEDLAGYTLDEAIERVRGGHNPIWKCEHRIRARDGKIHWVFESAVELRDEHGVTYGSIGMYQDITERKLAEAQIRYQASLLENVSDAIISTDSDFVIRSWNQGAEALYGWTEAEALGKRIRDLIPVQYGNMNSAEVLETFLTNGFWQGEVIQTRKDGKFLNIQSAVTQLKDASGKPTGAVAVNRNITEWKRMEASLARSEQQYRILYETIPSMNFTLDENGTILSINQFGLEQLGYTAAELIGQPITKLFAEEDRADILQGLRNSLNSPDQLHPWEKRKVKKDGTQIWVQEYIRVIRDEHELATLLVACYDITERKQAEEKIRRQVNFLTALKDIDRIIISTFDLRLSLRSLVTQAVALLEADAAAILLPNTVQHTLEFEAGAGFFTNKVQSSSVRFGESYAGKAALERRIIAIPDLNKEPERLFEWGFLKDENFVSYHGVPLIVKGKVIGVLEIFNRTIAERNTDWFDILEALAGQAAIAIDNAKLFDDLKRSNFELALAYDATIEGWSRALDLRDKETEGHTQRVTQQVLELARRAGIPDKEMVQVRYGALLHDIGKMGVPDHILLKASPLTPEEWDAMRRHPTFAFELLSPIRHLKGAALDIPYCHHEKWDGTGYPRGLQGEQIPFAARLFAVVDVWDAITSDRPYRKAWSKNEAMAYIQGQSGKQFDPRVVDEFLNLIR